MKVQGIEVIFLRLNKEQVLQFNGIIRKLKLQIGIYETTNNGVVLKKLIEDTKAVVDIVGIYKKIEDSEREIENIIKK